MAATSGLAISQNLCRITKKFCNKKCPKWQDMFKKMFEKSKMAATSGLAISRNLCRIAKKFGNKKVLNDKIWFFFEKSKMAATSGLAISRNLYRIAIKFWTKSVLNDKILSNNDWSIQDGGHFRFGYTSGSNR
jgi:hypothetical protein